MDSDSLTLENSDIIRKFYRVADQFPEKPALIFNDRKINYFNLRKYVNTIAKKLSEFKKTNRQLKVLVFMEKSEYCYASLLSVLAIGAEYAPLNIDLNLKKRDAILNSYKPDIILIDSNQDNLTPIKPETKVINVAVILKETNYMVDSECIFGEIGKNAYTIFTSGSSGIPKGVIISRAALNHYIKWSVSTLGLEAGKICSQHPNIGFDLSVIDIYSTLCSGGALVPYNDQLDKLFPLKKIEKHKINIWVSVPSVVDLMIKLSKVKKVKLGSLEVMFFCGEQLLKSHLDFIFGLSNTVKVINSYGPTEATVSCTELILHKDNYKKYCHEGSVSIGKPISGMKLSLENSEIESEGEIMIQGIQVANGYLNDPVMTGKQFGLGQNKLNNIYKTGDWARIINKNMYFVHRIDRQVKINGFRVELGEIDNALRQVCEGMTCATIYDGKDLISFSEKTDTDSKKIYEELKHLLPKYMLPNKIVLLTKIPLNDNDKIDYKALEKDFLNG